MLSMACVALRTRARRPPAPRLPVDILALVLEFYHLETVHEIASRRFSLVNKAWLDACHSPALWRTLLLSTRPAGSTRHCPCPAWERAPPGIRRAVKRHTEKVHLSDENFSLGPVEMTPYRLGRGLAGQRFSRLKSVQLCIHSVDSLGSYAADESALRPLFGAEALETLFSSCAEASSSPQRVRFLCEENIRVLYAKFPNLRRLALTDCAVPLFLPQDDEELFSQLVDHAVFAHDGEDADRARRLTLLDRAQAAHLVGLASISIDSFTRGEVPANYFPRMKHLQLDDGSGFPMRKLETTFREVTAACPLLEILAVSADYRDDDTEAESWRDAENYSVFAHAPPSLKALVLTVIGVALPCRTASEFAAFVKRHLPAGVQVHIIATTGLLEDNGVLSKGFWLPLEAPCPMKSYDDAVLADSSFGEWQAD